MRMKKARKGETVSKRKNIERAEAGTQFRDGRQVSKEEAAKIDAGKRMLSGMRESPSKVMEELFMHKPITPDFRCPECNSSRMSKEGLDHCPECGYVGKPVDVTGHHAEPPSEEQSEAEEAPEEKSTHDA